MRRRVVWRARSWINYVNFGIFLQALITLIAFVAALGILVGFHEFGHFLAARLCGVRVLRFSLGFGKPLLTYRSMRSAHSTEWVVGSIPFGGSVKLLDGRDAQQVILPEERHGAFDAQPLWQRSFIVAAGPVANFVLATVLFSVIYVSGAPQMPARLQAPPEQSLAARLDVRQGDQVIAWKNLGVNVNSIPQAAELSPVLSWNALRWELLDAITGHQDFAIEVIAPSKEVYLKIFKEADLSSQELKRDPFGAIGLIPASTPLSEWQDLRLNPLEAVIFASKRVWLISKVSTRMMVGFFTGDTPLKQLGGPFSIADMAGKSAQVGWQAFLGFLALLSISIGLLNLVPFPMLDGGQLLYDAWELVSGRRISVSMQERFQKIGLFLLMSLSLLALFNDLQRYLSS